MQRESDRFKVTFTLHLVLGLTLGLVLAYLGLIIIHLMP